MSPFFFLPDNDKGLDLFCLLPLSVLYSAVEWLCVCVGVWECEWKANLISGCSCIKLPVALHHLQNRAWIPQLGFPGPGVVPAISSSWTPLTNPPPPASALAMLNYLFTTPPQITYIYFCLQIFNIAFSFFRTLKPAHLPIPTFHVLLIFQSLM